MQYYYNVLVLIALMRFAAFLNDQGLRINFPLISSHAFLSDPLSVFATQVQIIGSHRHSVDPTSMPLSMVPPLVPIVTHLSLDKGCRG